MTAVRQSRRGLGSVASVGLSAPPSTPSKDKDKAQEVDVPLDKVPGPVRKAADKTISKAKWIAASKVTEDGELKYELDGTDSKGKEVTIVIATDGLVLEMEREVSMKEVPKVVTEALKKKLADFKVSVVHAVTEDGIVVSYSFEGKRPKDKEEVDVTVDADGSSVDVDDD
jgi:hypothetical protein